MGLAFDCEARAKHKSYFCGPSGTVYIFGLLDFTFLLNVWGFKKYAIDSVRTCLYNIYMKIYIYKHMNMHASIYIHHEWNIREDLGSLISSLSPVGAFSIIVVTWGLNFQTTTLSFLFQEEGLYVGFGFGLCFSQNEKAKPHVICSFKPSKALLVQND